MGTLRSQYEVKVEQPNKRCIDNLVFEGGGIKGFYHIGALLALEKMDLLHQVKRVAGSSIGSLMAMALAIGYNPHQLKEILLATKFKDFFDFSGLFIQNFIKKLINDKFPEKKDLTFAELRELTKRNPGLKTLYVTGVNIFTKKLEIFSDETTPDMLISNAIRISMTFPIIFFPGYYNRNLYIDGGLFDNKPSRIFDKEEFLPEGSLMHGINMNTLGISLSTPRRTAAECEYPRRSKPSFFMAPFDNTMPIFQLPQHVLDPLRTLYINTEKCSVFNTSISATTMLKEIEITAKEAEKYLELYYDKKNPHQNDGVTNHNKPLKSKL